MGLHASAKEVLACPYHLSHATAWSADCAVSRIGDRAIHIHAVLIRHQLPARTASQSIAMASGGNTPERAGKQEHAVVNQCMDVRLESREIAERLQLEGKHRLAAGYMALTPIFVSAVLTPGLHS